jgi:hypothetical protein
MKRRGCQGSTMPLPQCAKRKRPAGGDRCSCCLGSPRLRWSCQARGTNTHDRRRRFRPREHRQNSRHESYRRRVERRSFPRCQTSLLRESVRRPSCRRLSAFARRYRRPSAARSSGKRGGVLSALGGGSFWRPGCAHGGACKHPTAGARSRVDHQCVTRRCRRLLAGLGVFVRFC